MNSHRPAGDGVPGFCTHSLNTGVPQAPCDWCYQPQLSSPWILNAPEMTEGVMGGSKYLCQDDLNKQIKMENYFSSLSQMSQI